MHAAILIVEIFCILEAGLAESVFSHRQSYLKTLEGHLFTYHSEESRNTVSFYPNSNITIKGRYPWSSSTVFVPTFSPTYKSLLYGLDMEYSKNISYGYYFHSELYQEVGMKSTPPSLIRVNYGCCVLVSLDKYMAYKNAPFDELNFIDSFTETPSSKDGVSLRNLNVCSFSLCDFFSEESIQSFTPQPNYRYDVPYHPLSNNERNQIRDEIKSMFFHGYSNYMSLAYPAPQLDPLSCGKARFPQSDIPYMTLIDTLDTLHVLEFDDLFIDAVIRLEALSDFNFDENVSVFETTIRALGGLLSAHMLLTDNQTIIKAFNQRHPEVKPFQYSGHLLDLAQDLGNRLLRAFQPNGLAFGSVNLRRGVLRNETEISSLAGIGSCLLEFAALSSLTDDLKYVDAARRCMVRLYELRSPYDMVGKHVNIRQEIWTEQVSCFGRNSDSYYEYLVKGYILLNDPQLFDMFMTLYFAIDVYNKDKVYWHEVSSFDKPETRAPFSYSLSAFWPGVQFLTGDYVGGKATLMRFLFAWDYFGYIPEYFNIATREAVHGGEDYPLRPEVIESMMYHDIVFGTGEMTHWGKMILHQLNNTRTKCGWAAIKNINTGEVIGEMPSFMLSETLKYLYLLYTNDSLYRGRDWIFTTEGHLFNISRIQSNVHLRNYIREVNSLYEESTDPLWDLRCSAAYASDFFHQVRPSVQSPHCAFQLHPAACRRPLVPLQCPAVQAEELLQRPWVFEDLVFYSHKHQQEAEFAVEAPPMETVDQQDAQSPSGKKVSVSLDLDGTGNVVQLEVESIAQLFSLLKTVQTPRNWGESEETRLNRVAAKQKLKSLFHFMPPFRFLPTQNEMDIVLSVPGNVHVKIVDNLFCRFSSSSSTLIIHPLSFSSLLLMEAIPISEKETHPLNSTQFCSVVQVNHVVGTPDIPILCVFTLFFDLPIEFPCVIRDVSLGIRTETSVTIEEGRLEKDSLGNWVLVGSSATPTPISVQNSIEFDVEKEKTRFIVIDTFGLLEKYMEEDREPSERPVRAVFSIETQKVEYPSVFWYGNHVLVETDDYAVGLIQTIVLGSNVLLTNPNQGDDIIIQFQENDRV